MLTIRQAIYDFLFVFYCNYLSSLHHFRDIITYFPKLKKDTTVTTPTQGTVVIPVLKYHMFKRCTKFHISSFSHSQDILWGNNINGSRDHNNAPFRDNLSSVCWDQLRLSSVSNLKSLKFTHYKNIKGDKKSRNWAGFRVRGHSRSSETKPFNTAHM